jgi:Protein of unknown function (DUF2905)
MMNSETGKYIVIVGCGIVLIGIIVYLFHNKLHWIGHLPGDIRIERENFRFYFPIVTMFIFSALVSLIIKLIHKFFN